MESICQVCGKAFKAENVKRKFKFCRPACRAKQWRKSHPERNRKHQNAWKSKSVQGRLRSNISRGILNALKNNKKSKPTMKLIGCTVQELSQHLERQFKPGMTWQNHGVRGWHIDHKRPCCSFDLSKPEEQVKCFHFSNLQPLWWKDNCVIKRGQWDGQTAMTL